MRKFWMILPAAAAGLMLVSAQAQPPEGGRKGQPGGGERGQAQPREPGQRGQPGQPGGERGQAQPREQGQPGQPGGRGGFGGGFGMRGERGARIDAQVDAWVKTLTEKITDPHDEIRDSARAALVAVGRSALPTLQPLVNGDDGAKATAARKVIEAIEMSEQQRRAVMAGVNTGGAIGGFGGNFGGGMSGIGGSQSIGRGPGDRGNDPAARGGGLMSGGLSGDNPFRRPDAAPGDRNPNQPRPDARPDQPRPDARPESDRPRGDRPPGAEGPRGNPLETMLKDLDLNDKQRKQVEEIQKSHREKMRDLQQAASDGKIEREDMRTKRQGITEEMMKEMKEVLGEEQFTKFQDAFRNNAPRPGGDRRPEGRPERP